MQLQDVWDYKNQLMEDLLMHKEIVNLINEDMTLEQARDSETGLAYTQIFPYEYVPKTIQDGHTYVCFDVDVTSVTNKTYLVPVLYFWVFTHISRLRLPNGRGVRPDALCSEICKAINGSMYYGLGALDLYSVKRFSPMSEYNGKLMTFYMTEFNRPYDGRKPIPANRKTG